MLHIRHFKPKISHPQNHIGPVHRKHGTPYQQVPATDIINASVDG